MDQEGVIVMTTVFREWCEEKNLKIIHICDGSGCIYLTDKINVRRLKLHPTSANFAALKEKVNKWIKGAN